MTTSNNSENLGLTIIDHVAADNLTDVAADAAETLFDAFIDAGAALEAVPVFGTAVKLFRAGLGIHERLFLRKLSKFLLQLQGIPVEERRTFVQAMDSESAQKKRVGENLILLLDRLDNLEKAAVVGKLFRAYVAGRIDYLLFSRFAGIIDRSFLPDLARLKGFPPKTEADDSVNALHVLGLVYQSVTRFDNGRAYSLTPLGEKLAFLLL